RRLREADVERVRQTKLAMAVEREAWNACSETLPQPIPQGAHARGGGLEVAPRCITSSAEPNDGGDILRAGAHPALVARAEHERNERRAALHVERADALGSVELVAGDREEVELELARVDGHLAERLRRVGVNDGADGVRELRQVGDWLEHAGL